MVWFGPCCRIVFNKLLCCANASHQVNAHPPPLLTTTPPPPPAPARSFVFIIGSCTLLVGWLLIQLALRWATRHERRAAKEAAALAP